MTINKEKSLRISLLKKITIMSPNQGLEEEVNDLNIRVVSLAAERIETKDELLQAREEIVNLTKKNINKVKENTYLYQKVRSFAIMNSANEYLVTPAGHNNYASRLINLRLILVLINNILVKIVYTSMTLSYYRKNLVIFVQRCF